MLCRSSSRSHSHFHSLLQFHHQYLRLHSPIVGPLAYSTLQKSQTVSETKVLNIPRDVLIINSNVLQRLFGQVYCIGSSMVMPKS